jgi:putative methionine-R-sulfoxide reductase with GAF domain
MSASAAASSSLSELLKGLPALICETNIENQVTNVQKWIKPFLPVDGIGLSITGCHQSEDALIAGNIPENTIKEVEGHFDEGRDNAAPGALVFALQNGKPTVAGPSGQIQGELPAEATGLAFRLNNETAPFGTLVLVAEKDAVSDFSADEDKLKWFGSVFSGLFYNACAHQQSQENMRLFNLYETVSSSLCYAGDLHELLTTIISIVVSELPSEEGSILLYDAETDELEFFSAIGDTGTGYIQNRFPADKGIAGKALQEGQPVIVNDVQNCPFFFGNFDNESGFVTRSILAAPIMAGDEKVGVIEAINKVGESGFSELDKKILLAIADEVGLAVKNARMFDYVVNSYCKIRQGQMSCKGCVRPLRSWTPCARQLDLV